jgi:hypothetical protein
MKVLDPTFPAHEVIRKIVKTVKDYSDDTQDLVALASACACFAARWVCIRRGTSLTQEEWLAMALIAYKMTDDERAKDAIATN